MDPLSALFDASDDRTLELEILGPWSVALCSSPQVQVVSVMSQEAWLHHPEDPPVPLRSGDVAVLTPDTPWVLSHLADTPSLPVGPLPRTGAPVVIGRTGRGGTHLFVRTYPVIDGPALTLLNSLPCGQALSTARDSAIWPHLRDESTHLSAARPVVVSRLLDLLFVEVMRAWSTAGEGRGWLRASLDPIVGTVLHLVHQDPGRPWTLQALADEVGTSRTSLSRRFELLVGEPPMTYLREWRLTRAAHLLDEGAHVVDAARRCGFGDPFRFSADFYKRYGVSPAHYRRAGFASAGSA